MERNKLAPPTVVSVSRDGLTICGVNIPGLLKMPFPANVLHDLNVVDLPLLTAQIIEFTQTNHIKPSELVVVLDEDVYFEKQLVESTTGEMSQQVENFVDSVPLSNPSSKLFKVNNKYYAAVINRRLYESVRAAFEPLGFVVVAVVPELVIRQLGAAKDFDAEACKLVLHKIDYIKDNSFVTPVHDTSTDNIVNKNKGVAVGLSLGSILLMVGVIGVFSWQVSQSKQQAIARLKARAAESVQTVPEPTAVPTEAPSLSNLAIEILNASGSDEDATKTAQALNVLGITKISLTNATESADSTITYAPSVNTITRQIISSAIKVLRPNSVETQGTGNDFDVIVSLGKIAP